MRDSYFKFMSAIDIDCYKNIRDSELGNSLPYSDILQLFILGHKDKMTVSELATRLNLSRPATTQKVNMLEKKGFIVKRQSSDDKRVVYLSLSEKLVQSSQDAKANKLMDEVDRKFSAEKKAIFAEILEFMADYLMEE